MNGASLGRTDSRPSRRVALRLATMELLNADVNLRARSAGLAALRSAVPMLPDDSYDVGVGDALLRLDAAWHALMAAAQSADDLTELLAHESAVIREGALARLSQLP